MSSCHSLFLHLPHPTCNQNHLISRLLVIPAGLPHFCSYPTFLIINKMPIEITSDLTIFGSGLFLWGGGNLLRILNCYPDKKHNIYHWISYNNQRKHDRLTSARQVEYHDSLQPHQSTRRKVLYSLAKQVLKVQRAVRGKFV